MLLNSFSKNINEGKILPLKSTQLQNISNSNIASYGFKDKIDESEKIVKGLEETYRTNLRRQRDKIRYYIQVDSVECKIKLK